jgi:subtilisin family serine protease
LIDQLSGRGTDSLRIQGDSIFVFVRLNPGYHASDLDAYLRTSYVVGPEASPIAVYGAVKTNSIISLATSSAVNYVFPDVKLGFDQMKPDQEVVSQRLATDMFKVRQIIGADRVNQLGVNGTGVTIAIVDTGTDFTIPDLSSAIARNDLGQAISFDADGQSLALTNLTVTRFGDLLATKGKSVSVWNPVSYYSTNPGQPQIRKMTLHYNYAAPTVMSKSGNYHVGLLTEEVGCCSSEASSPGTVDITFPIVVVDANRAGVYDTVVFDMSTAYYNFLLNYRDSLNTSSAQSMNLNLTWPSPQPIWDDHGFADEQPHTASPGHDLIFFDPNNTGTPAFSAGLLSYGIDLDGITGNYDSLLPPIDPKGNFVNVFFDFEGHGTSTASNAASRGVLKRDIYENGTLLTLPGIAPAAKIMGVKALWIGDVTFAWYYAAGFDWDPNNFSFKYTGLHRADIISNSWGVSDPISGLGSTFGMDYLSELADAISLPHYLDPSYPGVVMLNAGGNGGFGFGTTTSPGGATVPITVGASTSYSWRNRPGWHIANESDGSYDEVIPWSARGPTSTGEPKPDVVNVGAYGFADEYSFSGYGNATDAYIIFGGTSMATPVTAGAVALIIQEYRDTHGGSTPPPDIVKAILSSSSDDLSYDQFTQGSGRVDVWGAVAAAAEGHDKRLPTRFYLYSPATWDTIKGFLSSSWPENLQTPIPPESSVSTNWYAGVVSPGSTATASFDIQNAINPSAQAFVYTLISTTTTRYTLANSSMWIQIPRTSIPTTADLMKVTLVYHFSDFVNATGWSANNVLLLRLYDTHFDSAGHVGRVTDGSPFGTTSELDVAKPLTKFHGIPAARIIKQQGSASEIAFELVIDYYQRSTWSWITRLSTTRNSMNVALHVPFGAAPGVYGGLIGVNDNGTEAIVPVSVLVPILSSGTYSVSPTTRETPYSNFEVYGAFDWQWRYETGDWRTFAIIVPPADHDLKVHLSWVDPQTDIQEHLVGPVGYLVASNEYPTSAYSGNGGIFYDSTTTGGPAQDIDATGVQPGVYLLVLHNVLYGGSFASSYPENYTLNIELA